MRGEWGGREEGVLSLPFPHSAPSHESSRRESRIPLRVTWYSPWYLIKKNLFPPFRAQDQERHKVLEIDSKGNLYLYRSALLCKDEIIKKLTEDNFKLVEPNTIGKVQSFTSYSQNSGVTSLTPLPNSPLSTLTTLIDRPRGKKNKCPSVYERLVLGNRL